MAKILLNLLALLFVLTFTGCGYTIDDHTDARLRGARAGLKDRTLRPACPRVLPEWSPFVKETSVTLDAYRQAYLETCSRRGSSA